MMNTAANRRELYNTSDSHSGVWNDYSRRRQAEAETGVNAGPAPTVLPGRGRPTAPPPSSAAPGPLPPGAAVPAMQAPLTPETGAPATVVPAPADSGAPATPATPAADSTGTPPAVPDASTTPPAQ